MKIQPDETKIEIWQNSIDDIENYKKQGTVIRSKEMAIINEETPNKFFYQKEQHKQTKKQIKQLQDDQNKMLKTNLEISKECQKFYQTLYEKQNNCEVSQEQLLKNIPKLVKTDQNKQLAKFKKFQKSLIVDV